jgi:myo-inositol-1(or 4)-monophosphatase
LTEKIKYLLELSKKTANTALEKLIQLGKEGGKCYSFDSVIPREVKATADTVIEKIILEKLIPTGIDILSEECGLLIGKKSSSLRFIIDPIDGTVNFVRGIADCSVSIALFDNEKPIFGVIASYPDGTISWGGIDIGAYYEGYKIKVSTIDNPKKGVLCTGFPSHYKYDEESISSLINLISKFGKTRMLGSASQSLLQVAKGAVEYYSEHEIMLWDVAAGIAILEGAGGKFTMTKGQHEYSLNVSAYNRVIDHQSI